LFERRVPARLTGINRARGRSAGARVRFPIAVTLVVGTPAPLVTPLIGMPISALDAVTGMPLALMRSR
jgi:Na+-transporting methylmalonyl-CoA/oxaloacetate decarboxylase beta subunit